MVGEVFAGVSGLKGILDLLKSLKDLNDAAVRERVAIDLQGKILAAYEQQAALLEQISTLKKEMARFETWETESQKYEFKRIGHGAFAYMLKPETRGAAYPHWVCATCYGDKRISVIQLSPIRQKDFDRWHCPVCKNEVSPFSGELAWID